MRTTHHVDVTVRFRVDYSDIDPEHRPPVTIPCWAGKSMGEEALLLSVSGTVDQSGRLDLHVAVNRIRKDGAPYAIVTRWYTSHLDGLPNEVEAAAHTAQQRADEVNAFIYAKGWEP